MCACGTAQRPVLIGGEIGGDANLPDQPDAHAAVADAGDCFGDNLIGDVIRAHTGEPRGVRGLEVEAAARDDVEAGALRDARERPRVAPDAGAGWVDDSPAAERHGLGQFGHRQLLVIQTAVVEVDERIHPQLAEDAGIDGLAGEAGARRLLRLVPPTPTIIQQMLVHQGETECAGRHRPTHGHHLA